MACYSGGAKGLVLDYASDEGAEMAPLTPETRAKLPGMIDPGLAGENPLDVGPTVGVQAGKFAEICKVVCADPTVDLVTVQGLMPVNPGDPYNPEPLRGVLASTDKPVLAFGRIAQNASEVSRKYQNETGVPFIHGLPETVRALQGLVRYAAALRRGVGPIAGAARARRKPGWRGLRCAARVAWTDGAEKRVGQDAGRSGRARRPHRLSGRGENRLARGEPQDRGRRRHARAARCGGGARRGRSHGRAAGRPRSRAPASRVSWCRRWSPASR